MKYYTPTKISENMHETPEGFLVCIGVPIARTGEMVYGDGETPIDADAKGKVLITRDEQEVFRPETIASFEGKAVTITHPSEFVNPENWSRLAKGTLQNVRRGEGDQKDDLLADLLITDSVAINLVKNGLREVSCGYEADYTQTDDGKGKQTNIIGNHLALVDQGRAGSAYAIIDHKGEVKMKLTDQIKKIFAKAQDEAMKIAEDAEKETPAKEKEEKANDTGAYDELVKMVKDLGEKISSMAKPKDEESPAAGASGEKEEKPAKDDETSGLEDRLKALETAVAKLLEHQAGTGDEEEEEGEETDDEDEEKEKSKDAGDFEKSTMVGDAASRAEILAPGIKSSKDMKLRALQTAYATKEGKKVIDSLSGGKPDFKSQEKVDTLFIAASELLKVTRTKELARTKTGDYQPVLDNEGAMTAEKMNEINAKHYKRN